MRPYKVLIAHQSTIPHYRIPFYNAITKLKPEHWQFEVVYDLDEGKKKRFFKEDLDFSNVEFPIKNTKTVFFKTGKTYLTIQDYIKSIPKYDLVIVEQAFNNLSYPLTQISSLFGKKIALWGHGRHMSATNPTTFKKFSEWIKYKFLTLSSGFFAYTSETENYLKSQGYPKDKIFVLNNTIDIVRQRAQFNQFIDQRIELRKSLELSDKKVLLFVGRLTHTKRLDYLVEAINYLFDISNEYHLLVVGAGDTSIFDNIINKDRVQLLGSITNPEELAPILCSSDLFVFPGQVGLGPLQAMCYDLPILTIDSEKHMPEYVYLNKSNSIVLKKNTSPDEFSDEIINLFNSNIPEKMRPDIWPTIESYTIDNMAQNMIRGINQILK